MCNFVPGEVVAIGPRWALQETRGELPGQLGTFVPLLSEPVPPAAANSELAQFGSLTLRTEPGMELLGLSRMSARLNVAIEKREAAVDLNHILPLSTNAEWSPGALRLSPHADREARDIRELLRSFGPAAMQGTRIAVLDSGLDGAYHAHRELNYLDYSRRGELQQGAPRSDPAGHGTRVVSLFDRILPREVQLSVGRLPAEGNKLTALTIAHALGDIVARENPQAVNLSIAVRNDAAACPNCGQRIAAATFHSALLPLVIRLCGRNPHSTLTVMAAGNSGQVPNSRWLTDDMHSLLFAVAENRHRQRARYSSAPEGPEADVVSAAAFGGDDPDEPGAQGVFADGTHGTSFAAPFVTATALATRHMYSPPGHEEQIGALTRRVIDAARSGVFWPPLR